MKRNFIRFVRKYERTWEEFFSFRKILAFNVDSIILPIEKNEEVFQVYIKNCTKNEKTILTKVLNYLKETKRNKYIENLIEENL